MVRTRWVTLDETAGNLTIRVRTKENGLQDRNANCTYLKGSLLGRNIHLCISWRFVIFGFGVSSVGAAK